MRTQRRRRSVSDFRYTPLVAALGAALAPQLVTAATITVTNPSDTLDMYGGAPPGSLRQAILTVNSACTGSDIINFNFPNGPFVSTVSQSLPVIFCGGLTIDGGGHQNDLVSPTQLQASPYGGAINGDGLSAVTTTLVTIKGMSVSGFTYGSGLSGNIVATDNIVQNNGTGIFANTNSIVRSNRVFSNSTGIFVSYGGETIQLNTVYNNFDGIDVESVDTGTIVNNFVGVDDGSRPDLPMNGNSNGIYLYNSTVNVQSNTISGNDTGVYLDHDLASTIQLNQIGTDVTGTSAVGNWVGIESGSPASGTVISGNVISGNSDRAIELDFVDSISITGNHIGTDVTRTISILNGDGVGVACASSMTITDNVIGTAYGGGIEFDAVTGGGTQNIVGNKIGVMGDGVTALGNNSYGVILRSANCAASAPGKALRVKALAPASATNRILVSNNIIANSAGDGMLLVGAYNTNITGNTITSNGGYGVSILSGLGNQILDNVIQGNSAYFDAEPKNINLGFFGAHRPNDAGDVDVDPIPNNGQNFPVITSVARNIAGNFTMVSFTLDSLPGTYRIDIYGNSTPTTEPGGDQILGNTFLTVGAGPTSGSFAVPGVTADFFSLLATSAPDPATGTGETSEFSFPVFHIVSAPGVSVSASSMDFGNVAVNTDSPSRSVTFTSSGSAPYQIGAIGNGACYGGSICYGGPFTCTSTCAPGSYAPGSSCQITATFHPPSLGSFSNTIQVCDNVAPFSRTISLAGTGVVPPPVSISPASFDFGSTLLGTRSKPSSFTITNPGAAPVSIGAPTVTAGFDVLGNVCGPTLGPGASCNVNVVFAPFNAGPASGTLSIAAATGLTAFSTKGARRAKAGAGSIATSALTGTATVQAVLDLPPSIDFGAYTAGTPAIRVILTLRNNGNAVLSLSSISATGPFTLGNGCTSPNLQPGDTCTLTLDYSAPDLGIHTGSLVVVSNATGGSRSVSLTANTVAVAAPVIRVSPLQIGFGDRLIGTTSASQRVTIANVGNAPAVLSPPVLTNTDFLVTTTCGVTLAPASSCFADVSLRPVGFGPRLGQLLINSNAVGSPVAVGLSGSGCRPFSSSASRLGANFGCLP